MPTGWPTDADVRAFLRLGTTTAEDDSVLTSALDAAIDYGNMRTNYRFDPSAPNPVPARPLAHFACTVHAALMFRRRDSSDGTIAVAESVVRVTARDPQVENNYAAIGPMVVG